MIQSLLQPGTKPTDHYWERFEQVQQAGAVRDPSWLASLRKGAMARFAETGFPTLQDEDWRFTNVAAIAKLPFQPSGSLVVELIAPDFLQALPLWSIPGSKMVFVNGQFAPTLSCICPSHAGVEFESLASALLHNPSLLEQHLGRYAQDTNNPFAALNTAFFTDGAWIHIPKGRALAEPIQLVHVALPGRTGGSYQPRHLILAESGSSLTVFEHFVSGGPGTYFTNAVTELVARDGSRIEHCKLQNEALSAYHVATFHAQLDRNSNALAHSFALGAKLSRTNIRTNLDGEGIECILNGLYLTKDDQLADHHMIVDHAKPNCNSHEYFNGVLDNRSRGVFHGRILVRPDAQKTDAKQTNKNLLLSDDAAVDTKPQLEIYADDVKCTHGATIGQLKDESIFYLRARGIGLDTARRMLMHAFAGEIIERIRHEAAREELNQLVWDRLEQNQQIAVAR